MRTNVTRGGNVQGVLRYLASEGRANEHTEQHLVAGDPAIVAMYGYDVLDQATAGQIARDLDLPRQVFGTEVTRLVTSADPTTGELSKERVAADVWHCSLSLRADEGQLTDEKWNAIATEFVRRMGFAGDDIGKANCRWVAVRHGLSKNGNDHVHIVVSLVREDGTKASVHKDFERTQKVSAELEREFGLQVFDQPEREYPERGVRPGAAHAAERRGAAEPDMLRLERAVRAAATAAGTEGEFVRRMRRQGVLIRPRFAAGRTDVVLGYSVALRPEGDERAVWHGGGRLARDLTLPSLRKGWPDSPQSAQEAVDEWAATSKNPWRYRPVAPGIEEHEPAPEMWQKYTKDVVALRDQLRNVPIEDRATWAHVARETAGAFAAWSQRTEATPGPLAEAARNLARSAQLRAHQSQPRPARLQSLAGAAMLAAHVASNRNATAAQVVLMRELTRLARSLHDMHQAAGDARRAREIRTLMTDRLRSVVDQMPTPTAELSPELQTARKRVDAQRGVQPGSPLPTVLAKREGALHDAPTTQQEDRGR